jgi:hypothetical protein
MWEDSYPLLHIDQHMEYARGEIREIIQTIERGVPDDCPEADYWRAYPQMFSLYRLLQTVRELLAEPYTARLKEELESERAREDDDEARADAMSY